MVNEQGKAGAKSFMQQCKDLGGGVMKRIPTLFTFSECHPNYRARQHTQQNRQSWKKGHVLLLPSEIDFYRQSFQSCTILLYYLKKQ